ncbi:twin-arginine translocation signal domain-containing protein, partial [Streptomyces zhihengii]
MTAFSDESATDDSLRRSLGVSRRRFLSTCTAVAGAAVAAPVFGAAPAVAHGGPHGGPHQGHGPGRGSVLVPADKRGIILYTVRDATGRASLVGNRRDTT